VQQDPEAISYKYDAN